MRMRFIPILTAFFALCLILSGCGGKAEDWERLYKDTGERLAAQDAPSVGSVGGEWLVVGLARSGMLSDEAAASYLENAEEYVQSIGSDRLHPVKSTENSRLILGITAAGGDPTDIGGYDLLRGLADADYIRAQGTNGPIWALIAFDCGDYPIPEEGDLSRENLVGDILSLQCTDGGWGFFGDTSDVDMTAMALQSLAPYREDEKVQTAAEKALRFLSLSRTADGGYESGGVQNCESCAQVIVALCSLGIDPQKDEDFLKNGHSVIESLCGFATEENTFCHQKDKPQTDAMATEQAYYALTAYHRYKSGMTSLYDMR